MTTTNELECNWPKWHLETLLLRQQIAALRHLPEPPELCDLEHFVFEPFYRPKPADELARKRKRRKKQKDESEEEQESEAEKCRHVLPLLCHVRASPACRLSRRELLRIRASRLVESQASLLSVFNEAGILGVGDSLAAESRREAAEGRRPRVFANSGNAGRRVGDFWLPGNCAFARCQMSVCEEALRRLAGVARDAFTTAVIDPPWPNSSASRRSVYATAQPDELLLRLPVKQLLSGGDFGLILLWCTNCEWQLSWAEDTLAAAWGCRVVGRWKWLKLTVAGEATTPVNSRHRSPWETLLLLKRMDASFNIRVPECLTFASVPSCLHSRKPNLKPLLTEIFEANGLSDRHCSCVELFARNLTEGWCSWGNEVIKHQHVDFYRKDSMPNCSSDWSDLPDSDIVYL